MSERVKVYVIEQSRFASGDVSGFSMGPGGEILHSHMSSSPVCLRLDTTENFGRGAALRERWGDFEVVYVSVDDELPTEIAHHFEQKENGNDDE